MSSSPTGRQPNNRSLIGQLVDLHPSFPGTENGPILGLRRKGMRFDRNRNSHLAHAARWGADVRFHRRRCRRSTCSLAKGTLSYRTHFGLPGSIPPKWVYCQGRSAFPEVSQTRNYQLNILWRRDERGVRHSASKTLGDPTKRHKALARELATFRRFALYKNSMPRGASR
jgi:hypothetical protein